LIDLQRRLTIVGAIRAGGEKPERGVGKKLEAWRLTSPRRELIEQAAVLYGGEPTSWASSVGEEWQTYTDAPELPVLVMPGYSIRQSYELWEGATKRSRLCDGIEEDLTGGPCICAAEGVDRCDLYTRLVVCLPELDTVLGWRLITRGANAALELPTMLALTEAKSNGRTFVPAKLRLDQRRGVKDGQTVRYVVPTLDLGIGYLALAQPNEGRELPSGPTPTPAQRREPTVEQALAAVEAPTPARAQGSRSAAAMGSPPEEHGPPPVPPDAEAGGQAAPEAEPAPAEPAEQQTKKLTAPQSKKLDVLVGKLRPDHLTTESLWQSIAGLRNLDRDVMIEAIGGRDVDGMLHWAPLRDSLYRPEAMQLIDWLEVKLARVEAAASTPAAEPEPVNTPEGDPGPEQGPIPYDEFPPGY
jgi:hypothetical protein